MIGTVSLTSVGVVALVFFNDKLNGAMLLAVWGFRFYIFQHYLGHFLTVTKIAKHFRYQFIWLKRLKTVHIKNTDPCN